MLDHHAVVKILDDPSRWAPKRAWAASSTSVFGQKPLVVVKQSSTKTQHGDRTGPKLQYPLVNQHNHGKSPFVMGKLTINGHFQDVVPPGLLKDGLLEDALFSSVTFLLNPQGNSWISNCTGLFFGDAICGMQSLWALPILQESPITGGLNPLDAHGLPTLRCSISAQKQK